VTDFRPDGFTPANLIEERDFLLRSIEDLERERAAGDISDDDFRELHGYYTARAAGVIRALAGDLLDLAPDLDDTEPRRRGRPVIVVVSILLAGVLTGWGIAASWGERLPGESASGSIELASTDQLARARVLLNQGDAVGAIKAFDRVLRDDPRNPEALAYRGWLLRLAQLPDRALEYIDRAIESDPSYPDAHFFKAMILYEDRHDPRAAVPEFRLFLASHPPADMVPLVQGVLDRAIAETSGGPG
jgi:tetratricopeptide (TPR) repeat protein